MTLKIYEYNRCGTCRKACKYLDEKGIAYEKIPVREQPPAIEELRTMLGYMDNNIKKLFNTSSKDYREQGIKDKLAEMTNEQAFELLNSQGNLIKRPFVLGDDCGVVGFKEEIWDKLFS